MEHKVKTLRETKIIFDELKIDRKTVLFSIDKLDTKELKKLKKPLYTKDEQLLKQINLLGNIIKK